MKNVERAALVALAATAQSLPMRLSQRMLQRMSSQWLRE